MSTENDPQWLKDFLHPELAQPKEVVYEELEDGNVKLSWQRGVPGQRVIAAFDLLLPTKERADRAITKLLQDGVDNRYVFSHRHVPIGTVKDENGVYQGGVGVSFGALTMDELDQTLERVYGTPPTSDMYRGLVQWAIDNATPLSTRTVLLSPHINTSEEAIAAEMIWLASQHLGENPNE